MKIFDIIAEDIAPRDGKWVDPNIGKIQQGLKDLGFDPGAVDNNFGPNTAAAVRKFQAANKLKVDGDPGPDTVAAMNKLLANNKPNSSGSVSPVPVEKSLSPGEKVVPKSSVDNEKEERYKKWLAQKNAKVAPGKAGMINPNPRSTSITPLPNMSVTQSFSMRHNGVDLRAEIGTPVKSPISGNVVFAEFEPRGGNGIIIDNGVENHYFGHLSKMNVSKGDKVNAGDIIGLTGNTGDATAPHLHWRKKVAGSAVDPLRG